jgi:hypothetical protein
MPAEDTSHVQGWLQLAIAVVLLILAGASAYSGLAGDIRVNAANTQHTADQQAVLRDCLRTEFQRIHERLERLERGQAAIKAKLGVEDK